MRVVLLVLLVASRPALGSPCPGDCDADAKTSIAELVRCVDVALARAEHESCARCDRSGDGTVTVDEVVRAVDAAIGDCRPSFVEASPAVGAAVADVAGSFRVLGFGYLRSFAAGAGAGAGTAPCVSCPDGGSVATYDCRAEAGVSTLQASFVDCRDGATTRSGTVRLVVEDPEFCVTCSLQSGVSGRRESQDFVEIAGAGAEQRTVSVPDTLVEQFEILGAGCPGTASPDRNAVYDGALRLQGGGRDVTFAYESAAVEVTSEAGGEGSCAATARLDGTVRFDDAAARIRFTQVASGLVVSERRLQNGSREDVRIDTGEDGSVTSECLGGAARIATIEPLRFPAADRCATAGLLEIELPTQDAPSAIRFEAGGGLSIDFVSEGPFSADRTLDRCDDPSLAQCRVLPPELPRTPTGTPTPTPTSTSTPPATRTATASPSRTSTSTFSPVPPATPTTTPTSTITPTVTVTPTVTLTPTVTPTFDFAPDGDDDGFSDAEEVEFDFDPADPQSSPLELGRLNEVNGFVVTSLNLVDLSAVVPTEATGEAVAIRNDVEPPETGTISEASGPPASALNETEPAGAVTSTSGSPVSVHNHVSPEAAPVAEAAGLVVSVENLASP